MEYILNVRNLTKKYGSFKALDGFTIVQISDLHNHRFGAGQARSPR